MIVDREFLGARDQVDIEVEDRECPRTEYECDEASEAVGEIGRLI